MTPASVRRSEIFRYLGYKNSPPDRETEAFAEECVTELFRETDARVRTLEFPLREENGLLNGGCFQTASRSLFKNLSGCSRVLVMAATLGIGADRLIRRYEAVHMAKALVMQAAAAAMTEQFCDENFRLWQREYGEKGLYLRPRFSPGYGDFPLSCQKGILDGLEAGRRLGIVLTEGGLMMPSKSVTAVAGIGREPVFCRTEGCEACGKTDCPYRRDTGK